MNLITQNAITFNDSVSTTRTAKIKGFIKEIHKEVGSGKTTIVYQYLTDEEEPVIYEQGKFILTDEEMDALYEVVKGSLPNIATVGHAQHELTKYYEGMRIKMAEKLSVSASSVVFE